MRFFSEQFEGFKGFNSVFSERLEVFLRALFKKKLRVLGSFEAFRRISGWLPLDSLVTFEHSWHVWFWR